MLIIVNNIIFGFIVGIILYKLFLKEIPHHGPNSNDIKKYIYKDGDKYYQFHSQICPCPI